MDPKLAYWLTYIDRFWYLTPDKKTSGNGIMYSVYWVMWLLIEKPDKWQTLLALIRTSLRKSWVEGGGMNRTPEGAFSNDLQQADDYFGLGLLDTLLGTNHSARLLRVARNNWGILNNANPGKWTYKGKIFIKVWIFRMPWVRTHLQFAAGEKPGPLGLAVWSLYLMCSLTRLKHRDSRVKAALCVLTALLTHPKNPIVAATCSIWLMGFQRKFKGLGQAESKYLPAANPARQYFWDRDIRGIVKRLNAAMAE